MRGGGREGQTEVRVEHISVSQRPLFKGLLGQQELVLCERGNPCNHFNSTVDFTGSDVKFSAVSVSLSHVSLAGISNGYCMLCDLALEASDWLFSCHPICVWEHANQTISGSLSKLLFGSLSLGTPPIHVCSGEIPCPSRRLCSELVSSHSHPSCL